MKEQIAVYMNVRLLNQASGEVLSLDPVKQADVIRVFRSGLVDVGNWVELASDANCKTRAMPEQGSTGRRLVADVAADCVGGW